MTGVAIIELVQVLVSIGCISLSWRYLLLVWDGISLVRHGDMDGSRDLVHTIRIRRAKSRVLKHAIFAASGMWVLWWRYTHPTQIPVLEVTAIRDFSIVMVSLILAYETVRDFIDRRQVSELVDHERQQQNELTQIKTIAGKTLAETKTVNQKVDHLIEGKEP